MKIGDTIEARVERSTHDGYGSFTAEGRALLVPGGTPGDRLRVRVDHLSPHRAEGWCSVLDTLDRGADFSAPSCPHAWPTRGSCGGCPLMHVADAPYSGIKAAWVERELSRGGLGTAVIWHSAPGRLGYRNRCNFVVTKDSSGALIFGSYAQRSNRVVSMTGCPALRDPLAEVAEAVRRALESRRVPVYPEPAGVRYVTVRHFNTGGVTVDLVVGSEDCSWLNSAATEISSISGVVGVAFSVNDTSGNAIRVADSQALVGQATGIERIGSRALRFAASSFAQLNTEVAEQMYRRAASEVQNGDTVWDLYCGAGGFGLCAASGAAGVRIFGAESVEGAVSLARVNAEACGVLAKYEVVDLERSQPERWPEPNVVLVNPPRRGLSAAMRDALIEIGARKIIYMSCNPASFATDAGLLAEAKWNLDSLDAWDMLPQTSHAELLAVMSRAG